MKMDHRVGGIVATGALALVLFMFSIASADEYAAMKGVDQVKVMFDVRIGTPKGAVDHMKLIHETCQQLAKMTKSPACVVVFMGSSVKLLSSNRAGFSKDDQGYLKELGDIISKMAEDGINFEVCLAAASYFGVDPASIASEIQPVGNGWISEIGYQARGYSLVPVY